MRLGLARFAFICRSFGFSDLQSFGLALGGSLSAAAATATTSTPAPAAAFTGFVRFIARLAGDGSFWGAELDFSDFAFAVDFTLDSRSSFAGRALGASTASATLSPLTAVAYFARSLVGGAGGGLLEFVGLFLIFELKEVGYIQERVALQTDVDECRLHAGQHAGDAAVINRSGEGIFVFPLVIDFSKLIVFQNREPRLMRR